MTVAYTCICVWQVYSYNDDGDENESIACAIQVLKKIISTI